MPKKKNDDRCKHYYFNGAYRMSNNRILAMNICLENKPFSCEKTKEDKKCVKNQNKRKSNKKKKNKGGKNV